MLSINSKVVSNHIKAQIVQLVQVVQMENKCSIEDAKETVRDFLIKQHNELMDSKWLEFLNNHKQSNDYDAFFKYLRLK